MLKTLLIEKRSAILQGWRDSIFDTYHPETSKLLKKKDRFGNPVGYAISQGIEVLYDGLVKKVSSDKFSPSIDNIIKIRAVQDLPSSRAVGFIFLLKKVIRETLKREIQNGLSEELLEFESGIDLLALYTFDIYTACREKIHEIKVNEIRKRSIYREKEKALFKEAEQKNE